MSLTEKVEHVLHRIRMHGGVPSLLRADEAQAGRMVIQPGEQPWLSLDDWHPDTVVSLEEDRVRLVLLNAARPGHGAFSRLIAQLRKHRLKPVVVAPSDDFAAALARRRWRSRVVWHGGSAETIWYPRRKA